MSSPPTKKTKLCQVESSGPVGPGGGNTKSSPGALKKVEKRPSGAKNWTFTWNNYPENYMALLAPGLVDAGYIIGKEIAPETGTKHLQGYVEFPKKTRPIGYMGMPKEIHWGDKDGKPAKGTKQHNIAYCSKDGDWEVSSRDFRPPREIHVWPMELEWQKNILKIIKNYANDRDIHWIWSHKGAMRKTSTCKYLALKHGAIVLGGKAADIRHAICEYKKIHCETPEIIVVNIPKSFSPEFVSYEGYENIKDMCFYSGKYEGGMVIGNPPHLFIFANFPPDTTKMQDDRWHVLCLDPENAPPEEDLSIGL